MLFGLQGREAVISVFFIWGVDSSLDREGCIAQKRNRARIDSEPKTKKIVLIVPPIRRFERSRKKFANLRKFSERRLNRRLKGNNDCAGVSPMRGAYPLAQLKCFSCPRQKIIKN